MTTPKSLPGDLMDSLLVDYKRPEDLMGEHGLLKQLTKALVERALQAEIAEHLDHDKHETVTNPTGNARNGKRRKTLNIGKETGSLAPRYSLSGLGFTRIDSESSGKITAARQG